jgi:hypothetical protein
MTNSRGDVRSHHCVVSHIAETPAGYDAGKKINGGSITLCVAVMQAA